MIDIYSAKIAIDYAHVYGTTVVVHNAAINDAQNSAGSTISVSASCADTITSATVDEVETCMIAVVFSAAADSLNTAADFGFHAVNNQVTQMTLQ